MPGLQHLTTGGVLKILSFFSPVSQLYFFFWNYFVIFYKTKHSKLSLNTLNLFNQIHFTVHQNVKFIYIYTF